MTVESDDLAIPLPPVKAGDVRKVTRGGPVPRLDTYWRVEAIVRKAHAREEDPISFEDIKRRLGVKSVRHSTVRACISEMERQGNVTVFEDGVFWGRSSPEWRAYVEKRGFVTLE